MRPATEVRQQVSLAGYTTLKIGGPADYFVVATTRAEVQAACDWAAGHSVRVFVLGEGSNIVVSDGPLHRLVLKVELTGFEPVTQGESVRLTVGAGEHWDDVVARTVELGLAGVEAMSMIPGTTGATPVQNAGAYGQEIADTLVELEAYDMDEREFVTIPAADCGFVYRSSKFRGEWAGRFVITSVTLKLNKRPPKAPTYESLKRYLDEQGIRNPSLAQIRDGVMAVRARILPDPMVVPNVGSFFKNPIVDEAKLAELEAQFERVPSYAYEGNYKIAAGWLVEHCGLDGQEHFGLSLWPKHWLVITNSNRADFAQLMKLVELIVRTVQRTFGITLEPEPEFVR